MTVSRIPVLYFHSVASQPDSNWSKSYLTVSLWLFERILRSLSRRHYEFVFLSDLVTDEAKPGRKKVCLTFDDGYLDNFVYAFPILKRYNAKATIFISPEYVDRNEVTRYNLEDVWDGRCYESDLPSSGFLSWQEMRLMEASGYIDIQSHALTHTKQFCSDRIRDFHHSGADCLNPIGNLYPSRKPYYMSDSGFSCLLPYGTPFFKEASALITKAIRINPEFSAECVRVLHSIAANNYSFDACMKLVSPIYCRYKELNTLVESVEDEYQYCTRVFFEISESKRLIDMHLGKQVACICWPYGDYNQFCIDAALQTGYRFVHAVPGKGPLVKNSFTRIGVSESHSIKVFALFRTIIKLESCRGVFPFNAVEKLYRLFRAK